MLHNENHCGLYPSCTHVRTMTSWRLWWVSHVTNMTGKEYVRNIYGEMSWKIYTQEANSEITRILPRSSFSFIQHPLIIIYLLINRLVLGSLILIS